ncbi:twitching motility protein, partial [Desulfobulbus sp. F3]|nr:twitching motility protein [Desulfobulbus sp. F3]
FYSILTEGVTLDMRTFDQHILQLFGQGLISAEVAMTYCSNGSVIKRGMDTIKATRGESTSNITGLAMEQVAEKK